MAEGLFEKVYNPDVLSCLANLSNDEVFTPPEIANQMLDLLPQELFADPNTTFLDPACKSGVFLREIAKRLLKAQLPGYEEIVHDLDEKKRNDITLNSNDLFFEETLQKKVDHIFHKQLYGISITELTSLLSRRSVYCSKYPNSEFSVTPFETVEGNIRYRRVEHVWQKGKCVFCGASQTEYERDQSLETHAYEWIHTLRPGEIFNMKFDVIIGNPPYQLNTGSTSAQAIPLYDKFVDSAKMLKPRFISMIIPSRWFAGGMGLDKFRENMLTDGHISKLVDYANAKDCFEGLSIGGGVCYFLWDKNYSGPCEITNAVRNGNNIVMTRELNEFPVFVRYNNAVSIIHKVLSKNETSISDIVSSLSPFGIGSAERGHKEYQAGDVKLYSSKGAGFFESANLTQGAEFIDKYQVAISKVTGEHAGEPGKDGRFKVISKMWVLNPQEVCTFSYFLIGNESSKENAMNILSYLTTKFARFLLLQSVSSINISKDKFRFIPTQDFRKSWTDEELYAKYGFTQDEIDFIENMIKPMDAGGEYDA